MLRYKLLIILAIQIFLSYVEVKSQTYEAAFEKLTFNDGLSSNNITCIFHDSRGFIWFGTDDGLNKYDGYSFVVYRNDSKNTSTISNNYINDITEDNDGTIWIATRNGLNAFSRTQNTFARYFTQNANTKLSGNIPNIHVDASGVLWMNLEKQLAEFNVEKQLLLFHERTHDRFINLHHGVQNKIIEDTDNNIWCSTIDGIFVFNRHTRSFRHHWYIAKDLNTISSNVIQDIYIDSRGTIWSIAENGINKYVRKNRKFERYPYTPKYTDKKQINCILENSGKIWVGTEDGLYQLNTTTKTYEPVYVNKNRVVQPITALYKDQSNIFWIGTHEGIFKINLNPKKFQLITSSVSPKFQIETANALFTDEKSRLWIGSTSGEIAIYNKATKQMRLLFSHFKKTCINEFCSDKAGNILVATNEGILIFDEHTLNEISPAVYFSRIASSLKLISTIPITHIYYDDLGSLWFSSINEIFNYSGEQLYSYKLSQYIPKNQQYVKINSFKQDKKHSVWVGTSAGLFELIKSENKHKLRQIASLKTDVYDIAIDAANNLWLACETGLIKYSKSHEANQDFEIVIPNEKIVGILPDKYNQLWLSTNKGIWRFSIADKKINIYNNSDGLQGFIYKSSLIASAADGDMYLGGDGGINRFNPDSISINSLPPKISLTSYEIIGKKGKVFYQTDFAPVIKLSNDAVMLTLNFAALDYTNPRKNSFVCFDDRLGQKMDLYYKNSYYFAQLSPGKYVIKIIGANADQVWNNTGITLTIIKEPAFYNSMFAYFLYILFAVAFVFIFMQVRTGNLRKTNQDLIEKQIISQKIAAQKEELSIKNQNITDSLNYAKRIIDSMMATDKFFKRLFPQSFCLFKPKDIVSGDFYWLAEKGSKKFIAAVDCTGHGVPGAFMSIIGLDLLKNITDEQGIQDAAEILNRLNAGIYNTFSRDRDPEENTIRDGMDITLCVIDKSNNTLQFAGAVNPLYLVRNNNIIEYKADRFSLGAHSKDNLFANQVIEIQKDDVFYLFTDGYTDQFGGPYQKKFKFRRFRHILLSIHNMSLDQQKDALEKSIINWQGDLEQVDDMLVIGIKPYREPK